VRRGKKDEDEKPDVILMDINLPGIDGRGIEEIRMVKSHQCVIMLKLCHGG